MKVKLVLLFSLTLCCVILFRMSFNTFFAKTSKTITYHTAKSFKSKKLGADDLKRRNLKASSHAASVSVLSLIAHPVKATLVKKIKLPSSGFPVNEYFFTIPPYNISSLSHTEKNEPSLRSAKHILISVLRI